VDSALTAARVEGESLQRALKGREAFGEEVAKALSQKTVR
jgi:hypothetical protein